MWLSYSRTVCFHGDCAAWVSSHIVSPSFVSSSYLEVFAKGGLIHLEYFPLLEGVVSLGKRETQKFRDVQLGSFPKFLPSVKLLLGEPTEINSSSLRKLQCSYSIKQEISRIADRYSWCAITFPSRQQVMLNSRCFLHQSFQTGLPPNEEASPCHCYIYSHICNQFTTYFCLTR